MKTTRLASLLVGCSTLALPVVAFADDGTTASIENSARTGATIGVSAGVGDLGCTNKDGDNCTGDDMNLGYGAAIHAGAMLTPQVALLADLSGVLYRDSDDFDASQGILAGAARIWVAPQLWLQGGLGVARASARLDVGGLQLESETDTVPAAIAGIGVELFHAPHYALDLEVRGGSGLYRDDIYIYNLAAGIGASWY